MFAINRLICNPINLDHYLNFHGTIKKITLQGNLIPTYNQTRSSKQISKSITVFLFFFAFMEQLIMPRAFKVIQRSRSPILW